MKIDIFFSLMLHILFIFCTFGCKLDLKIMEKDINRLKIVLVEQKRTGKWLAEQLGKDPATISKWCTNSSQPGLETLMRISEILGVDSRELLVSNKPKE